jgi:hypothetical protein
MSVINSAVIDALIKVDQGGFVGDIREQRSCEAAAL